MNVPIPELLRKMLDANGGGGQAALAKRMGKGISQPDISRWLKGVEPERQRYNRIIEVATEIGVLGDTRSEDVAHSIERTPRKTVKIKGYVGANDTGSYFNLSDEEFTEVDAPAGATDQTVAVEIMGTSFGPLLQHWLVFYDDVRSPVTPDLYGVVCVVGLSDDKIVLKKIQSNGRGGFNLLSNSPDVPAIEDASIEWAAKVIDMKPK